MEYLRIGAHKTVLRSENLREIYFYVLYMSQKCRIKGVDADAIVNVAALSGSYIFSEMVNMNDANHLIN